MKEGDLLKLALLCSVFGITGLFAASLFIESPQTDISSLNVGDVSSTVTICGNLTSHTSKNGHHFFNIADTTGQTRLVFFNTTTKIAKERGFDFNTPPKKACIEGEIDEYPTGTGNLEIVYAGGKIK